MTREENFMKIGNILAGLSSENIDGIVELLEVVVEEIKEEEKKQEIENKKFKEAGVEEATVRFDLPTINKYNNKPDFEAMAKKIREILNKAGIEIVKEVAF